jgi:hypothetical protein
MNDEHRLAQLQRGLLEMGGTHDLADIIKGISEGTLQSFVEGETWAVTTVIETPKKRICEVFLVVGDMEDAVRLHDTVEAFARAHGCNMLRTIARKGWSRWAKPRGWTNGHTVYLKELV